eukprot:4506478-Prymnesium_polylepis.1
MTAASARGVASLEEERFGTWHPPPRTAHSRTVLRPADVAQARVGQEVSFYKRVFTNPDVTLASLNRSKRQDDG